MIEALIKAGYRLPSDFDTIVSIVRLNDEAAIITSVFAVWEVRRDHYLKDGFTVTQLARRP